MSQAETSSKHREKLPPVPTEVRALIDAADYSGVEDLFIQRLEEFPDDFDFFIGTFRSMCRGRHADLAETLLDLLLENMAGDDTLERRLWLARICLRFWPDCRPARRFLGAAIRAGYPQSRNYDMLAKHCRITTSHDPAAALEQLETWLKYDEGQVVFMPTKGVGDVVEINLTLETVRVRFAADKGKPMSFRITEAQRLLEPLPKGHILRDKVEHPEELAALAETDPGEVLRRLFTSLGRPLAAAELKEMLAGVVPSRTWSSWWTKARKDPRLVVGSGTRGMCTWSESAAQAHAEVLHEFHDASPQRKLEMVRTYAGRSRELASAMAQELGAVAQQAKFENPALALEIALMLQARLPEVAGLPEDLRAERLLAGNRPHDALLAVRDRGLRKAGLVHVRETRDDWPLVYNSVLFDETDSQCVGLMYDALRSHDAEQLDEKVCSVLHAPETAPALFVWLCRETRARSELRENADWSLVKSILSALGLRAFKEYHAVLRNQFEPGGAAHIAIGQLRLDQARELLSMLDRDIGLESYRKEQLRTDLRNTYPDIAEGEASETFYVTSQALEAKREEFLRIIKNELPESRNAIKAAKEWGDLSENFEYHAARARQEMLSSRAKTLADELKLARALEPAQVDPSTVTVGTCLTLQKESDGREEIEVFVLGPWDSNPLHNVFSYTAPAIAEWLGCSVGDAVRYHSDTYRIAGIRVWK